MMTITDKNLTISEFIEILEEYQKDKKDKQQTNVVLIGELVRFIKDKYAL